MPTMDIDAVRKRIVSKERTLLRDAPKRIVDALVKRGEIIELRKGDVVFKVDDDAGWFYVLADGLISTELLGKSVRSLVPGEIGGLVSTLPDPGQKSGAPVKRVMSHVVVSERATILKVPAQVYVDLVQSDKEFGLHAIKFLHYRLKHKTSKVALLTGSSGAAPAAPHRGDLNIVMFDTKSYDQSYFEPAVSKFSSTSPRITIKYLEPKLNESTVGLAIKSNAVCVFVNDVCNAKVLQGLHSAGVRLVLLRCAGFNNVDLKEAEKLGIAVLRVPAYSPNAVAEHAFALLATVNRRTARAYSRVRDGNFALHGFVGRDLKGLTAGVAGCGKIGECFVSIAKGCGMKVLVFDEYLKPEKAKEMGVEQVSNVDDLFKRSDVISLHVPLTKETKHLVNEERLKMMKKGSIIINTSRGPIIDARALARALIDGTIGGAGLDVYEGETEYFFEDRSDEPIKDDVLARLVNLPNCVVTSHQAFLTDKALTAIAETTVANAAGFQEFTLGKRKADDVPNAVVKPKADSNNNKSQSKQSKL
jgi:D-lactate dehydrogenase